MFYTRLDIKGIIGVTAISRIIAICRNCNVEYLIYNVKCVSTVTVSIEKRNVDSKCTISFYIVPNRVANSCSLAAFHFRAFSRTRISRFVFSLEANLNRGLIKETRD